MRLLLAIVMVLAVGCSSEPDVDAAVIISNIRFEPSEVSVPVGGTVEWTFDDGGLLHEVHADGVFDSGVNGDNTFRFTFDEPGDVDYQCSIHPHMTGTIHVG
ncbi:MULTISPECIES: biphenyl 2,3-dioxygenase [Nocardiaceae]|uniref:Plastocyanin n=1 Tax=Rhodococcoides corynebacterioides TaxID=53972 RepID=A0ABS2KV02_9NOCA|nr:MULTISPECIES: biphenyl 2,3-dioxygenase [Rhodococcus]MBM7415774.1 plastocyanin [Rhodococcus corynebacterioides]MBP1118236.1 plastocyanin [Rhodococcus sp. PvP016]